MRLTADVQGTAPFPMKVCATGMFACSANVVNASAAPPRMAPFPARMIGCRARLMRAAARFTLSGSGAGRLARSRGSGPRPRGASSCPMFSGSSTWVGPGRSAVAILNAFRMISGTVPAFSTRAFHFAIGSKSCTTSMNWCDSRWTFDRSAWAVIATSGARSRNASATPVTRFVAPGPRVARHRPGSPVSRPWMFAMNAAASSCRVNMNRTELS